MTMLTPHAMLQNHPTNRSATVISCDSPTQRFTKIVMKVTFSCLEDILVLPPQSMKNPLSIVPGKKDYVMQYTQNIFTSKLKISVEQF